MRLRLLTVILCCLFACNSQKAIVDSNATATQVDKSQDTFVHAAPDWAKDKWIYEVNIRQFSKEGTFAGVERHLPRLKQMGIQVILLMPIYPVGEKNRRGVAGNYYAVQDYRAVNPVFGTLEDLQSLIDQAHLLEMKVLFDWVAGYSASDCNLVADHRKWYAKTKKGDYVNLAPSEKQAGLPATGVSDIAAFNYDAKGWQEYMMESMAYWVETCNIDGFRCKQADLVPLSFWMKVKKHLLAIKSLLLVADAEDPALLFRSFHMVNGKQMYQAMNAVASGKEKPVHLKNAMDAQISRYGGKVVNYTSSHYENFVDGSTDERMGDAALCFAHFINAIPGTPLLYGGQEAPLKKRLDYFEQDPIDWGLFSMVGEYQTITKAKKEHSAFWNDSAGGTIEWLPTSDDDKVLAFLRKTDEQTIVCIFNMSDEAVIAKVDIGELAGPFSGVTRRENRSLRSEQNWKLAPWDFRFYRKVQ